METPPKTFVRARALRKTMSRYEIALWHLLRAHRLDGLKFRRQHPIGPYILDFYCGAAQLAVEIDGPSHDTPQRRARDAARDIFVRQQGIATLRIAVGDLNHDMEKALDAIRTVACKRIEQRGLPHPPLARHGVAEDGVDFDIGGGFWVPLPASMSGPERTLS